MKQCNLNHDFLPEDDVYGDQAFCTKHVRARVDKIKIKTANEDFADSKARAVLELCDPDGHCCQTSPDGRGLYNGNTREKGQIEVYSDTTILGECAYEVIYMLTLVLVYL